MVNFGRCLLNNELKVVLRKTIPQHANRLKLIEWAL